MQLLGRAARQLLGEGGETALSRQLTAPAPRLVRPGVWHQAANRACTGRRSQLGQLLDPSAQRDCGAVSLAGHLIGWLLGAGILTLAAAALLRIRGRPGRSS